MDPAREGKADHQPVKYDMRDFADEGFPAFHARGQRRRAVHQAPGQTDKRQEQNQKSKAFMQLEGVIDHTFRQTFMRHQPAANDLPDNQKGDQPVKQARDGGIGFFSRGHGLVFPVL